MTAPLRSLLLIGLALASTPSPRVSAGDDSMLHLKLRSRAADAKDPTLAPAPVEKVENWDPKKTAIIVVDMWDDHWCSAASRRVSEMAVPLNQVLKLARAKGVFVIHSPSSVT